MSLISISSFPNDQFQWRVDWLGDIAFPDRTARRKQPSVFVHLSKVLNATFANDLEAQLSAISTTQARYQRKVWVSVGTLPLLRVGDVWRNAALEFQPDYELETFENLQIDRDRTSLIKAGLNIDDKGYLLPIAEHPWHMQCTQSYCVMVNLPNDKKLIIPCMELIRFYFGSSSSLLSKLFMPALNRQMLYSNSHFNQFSGKLNLDLATDISGASAADIGRLRLDHQAWLAALQIGTSCLAASTTGQQAYPKTFFPFEGQTTLIASGKWLSFGDKPRSTFVVYNLRSCSHPFPFKTLRYETHSSRPKPPVKSSTQAHMPATDDVYRPRGAADARGQGLAEQDASDTLAPKTKKVRFESKFPDLKRKTIWKSLTLTGESNNLPGSNPKIPPVQHASVGDPGSSRRVRPIELVVLQDGGRKPIPEFLRATITDVSSLTGFDIELLSASEDDGWTVPVTLLSDEDGEIDARLFFELADGIQQFRRACVLAFKKDSEHLCAVVIEADVPHVKLYPTTGQNAEEVWQTLRCATSDFLARPETDSESLASLIEDAFTFD
jgi:hypothetical protein